MFVKKNAAAAAITEINTIVNSADSLHHFVLALGVAKHQPEHRQNLPYSVSIKPYLSPLKKWLSVRI